MSFKVIDPRSGTKGVLHQWRHTGSKPRDVLWCIFKHPGRGWLPTHRRVTSATRHNSTGSRLPAAICGIQPELGLLWTPSSAFERYLDQGLWFSTARMNEGHPQHLQTPCAGKGGRGGGKSSVNASKRPTGAAVLYQAQQAHFVGNCCLPVQNFLSDFHLPRQETGCFSLRGWIGNKRFLPPPSFSLREWRLGLTNLFRHHLESFITSLSWMDGFSDVCASDVCSSYSFLIISHYSWTVRLSPLP